MSGQNRYYQLHMVPKQIISLATFLSVLLENVPQ